MKNETFFFVLLGCTFLFVKSSIYESPNVMFMLVNFPRVCKNSTPSKTVWNLVVFQPPFSPSNQVVWKCFPTYPNRREIYFWLLLKQPKSDYIFRLIWNLTVKSVCLQINRKIINPTIVRLIWHQTVKSVCFQINRKMIKPTIVRLTLCVTEDQSYLKKIKAF